MPKRLTARQIRVLSILAEEGRLAERAIRERVAKKERMAIHRVAVSSTLRSLHRRHYVQIGSAGGWVATYNGRDALRAHDAIRRAREELGS